MHRLHVQAVRGRGAALLAILPLAFAVAAPPAQAQQQQQQQQRQQERQQQQRQRRQPSPERIRDLVKNELAASPSLAGTQIDVTVDEGAVNLSGTVGSEGAKERAARIAQDVRGVNVVNNQLSVDAQATEQRQAAEKTDEELARSIAQSLAQNTFPGAEADEEWLFGWEVEGDDWEFDVDVDGGEVTLEGSVDDYADIAKAVDAVRRMEGVRSVDSDLWVSRYGVYPQPYAWNYGYDPYWYPYTYYPGGYYYP